MVENAKDTKLMDSWTKGIIIYNILFTLAATGLVTYVLLVVIPNLNK
ncbi:MAG: hypothetical protein KGZ94_02325 [Clostridia bacterium]|jgi:hypothetical protein|nr:hypothetical protein [Clostridia bacterium]